jgi:hypothetical protein
MWWYQKFVESGQLILAGAGTLSQIGAASGRFLLNGSGPTYRAYHEEASGAQSSGVGGMGTPNIGDIVELLGVLNADGSVTCRQSINGGAEQVGTTSAALALASAWTNQVLLLTSQQGLVALKVGPGTAVNTMALARAV